MKDWSKGMTAFEVLVSTVLSQSTTIANERRGLEGLRTTFGQITPEILARARDDEIAAAIWHAGLARQKAPRIRRIAKSIWEAWNGRVERILELPTEAARAALMGDGISYDSRITNRSAPPSKGARRPRSGSRGTSR